MKSPRRASKKRQSDRLNKLDKEDEEKTTKAQMNRLYTVSKTRASIIKIKRKSEGPASFAGKVAGNALLPLYVLEELRAEEEAEAAKLKEGDEEEHEDGNNDNNDDKGNEKEENGDSWA
jgi:hypothetical protein